MQARIVLSLVGVLFLSNFASLSAEDTRDNAKFNLKPGNLNHFQVDTRTEIQGTLYLDPTEETRSVSMDVKATYRYGERLATKQGLIKAIRFYDQAQSNIKLSTGSTVATLDANNRYLILERREYPVADKRVRFQSPQPTLSEAELNLINVPFNSMLLSHWLKKSDVKIGQTWQTDATLLADVLTWDFIEKNEITAKLVEVNLQQAQISLTGKVTGIIDGAATEATIKGTCVYDLRQGFVSSIRVRMNENREAGIVAPGFEANIWMETSISPAKQTRLTNAALGQLKMSPSSKADQLQLKAACGPYLVRHSRNWRVISNRGDRTVMRCIKDGIVLGQCDIVPLPNQPAGTVVSLDHFKSNVQKTLTNSDGQVIKTQQSPSISQQKWMRVDAIGTSENIAMRWIYCTVTAPDLRRVQLLFTLEENAFNEFSGMDQELIDAIVFEPLQANPEKTGRSADANKKRNSPRR